MGHGSVKCCKGDDFLCIESLAPTAYDTGRRCEPSCIYLGPLIESMGRVEEHRVNVCAARGLIIVIVEGTAAVRAEA